MRTRNVYNLIQSSDILKVHDTQESISHFKRKIRVRVADKFKNLEISKRERRTGALKIPQSAYVKFVLKA